MSREDDIQAGVAKTNVPHGTKTRYNYGCRCEACSKANRELAEEARQRRKRETPFDEIPHGFAGYNNYLCRCDVCKAGKKVQNDKTNLRQKGIV